MDCLGLIGDTPMMPAPPKVWPPIGLLPGAVPVVGLPLASVPPVVPVAPVVPGVVAPVPPVVPAVSVEPIVGGGGEDVGLEEKMELLPELPKLEDPMPDDPIPPLEPIPPEVEPTPPMGEAPAMPFPPLGPVPLVEWVRLREGLVQAAESDHPE